MQIRKCNNLHKIHHFHHNAKLKRTSKDVDSLQYICKLTLFCLLMPNLYGKTIRRQGWTNKTYEVPSRFKITDRSNVVVLLWLSVACFWCQFRYCLQLMYVHLSGHLIGMSCSLSLPYIFPCYLIYFLFWFRRQELCSECTSS